MMENKVINQNLEIIMLILNNLLEYKDKFPQILKREFQVQKTEEKYDIQQKKTFLNILGLIAEFVEKKDINSFINIITYINEINKSEDFLKYIQLFMPYYKFRSSKLHELNA